MEERFSNGSYSSAVYLTAASIQTFCNNETSLVFASSSGQLMTVDLTTSASSFIFVNVSAGCARPLGANTVTVRYSTNQGVSWSLLVAAPCTPSPSSGCTAFSAYPGGSATDTAFMGPGWNTLVFPVPAAAQIRFQVATSTGNALAVSSLYIGAACPDGCGYHGICSSGQTTTSSAGTDAAVCRCNAGYASSTSSSGNGSACVPDNTLAQELRETFEGNILPSKWSLILGGSQSTTCGTLASGSSMVFNAAGLRVAMTTDLNTVTARYMELTVILGISSGSCIFTTTGGRQVNVAYSTNAYSWNVIDSSRIDYYSGYRGSATRLAFALPTNARGPSVRFMLFQYPAASANVDVWVSV